MGLVVFGAVVAGGVLLFGSNTDRTPDQIARMGMSTLAAAFVVLLFAGLALRLTRCWETRIPRRVKTIRDVIPYAVTSDRMPEWTREEVAVVVKRLTMEQMGLKESQYTEDSRFVEDLHID